MEQENKTPQNYKTKVADIFSKISNMNLQHLFTITIAIGVWIIVIQNIFLLNKEHKVRIIDNENPISVCGSVGINDEVKVNGSVWVNGNVGINNCVDINLQSINGYSDAFFNNPRKGDKDKYYTIPVVNFGY